MRSIPAVALGSLLLVAAACSDSESVVTTSTTVASSTTATTEATTTTEPASTTTEATTTTEPASTTTEATTTTTRVALTPSTTTMPSADADPDLVPWAGLFRQPTSFNGFLDFQANGIIRAGTEIDALNISGSWDYDEETDEFLFNDFDFGVGCDGAAGRYVRETARGGGRRIVLVDDPCQDRVDFITQPGAACLCFLYNLVDIAEADEEVAVAEG